MKLNERISYKYLIILAICTIIIFITVLIFADRFSNILLTGPLALYISTIAIVQTYIQLKEKKSNISAKRGDNTFQALIRYALVFTAINFIIISMVIFIHISFLIALLFSAISLIAIAFYHNLIRRKIRI